MRVAPQSWGFCLKKPSGFLKVFLHRPEDAASSGREGAGGVAQQ